jgi:hypothetical protein
MTTEQITDPPANVIQEELAVYQPSGISRALRLLPACKWKKRRPSAEARSR